MGNCSCINNIEPQVSFPIDLKINQDELLNNIKLKFQNSDLSVESITDEEFNNKLLSFPKAKDLLEEYNLKINELS